MTQMTYKTYSFAPTLPERRERAGCAQCDGDMPEGVEHKFISAARKARFQELKAKLEDAKAQGHTHKVWKTVGDGRILDSHVTANRQRVKIDDDFTVGGERLFLPSDPKASFAETANCRCDVEFVKEAIKCPLSQGIHNSISVLQLLNHFFKCDGRRVIISLEATGLPKNPIKNAKFRKNLETQLAPYKEKTGKFHFDFQIIVAKVDFVTLGQITTRLTGTLTSTKKGYTIEARLAAYNDTYDFDPKINGRDIAAELATRVFSTIENGRGTPFEIAIVGERFIKLSGLWDTLGQDFTPRLPRPTV